MSRLDKLGDFEERWKATTSSKWSLTDVLVRLTTVFLEWSRYHRNRFTVPVAAVLRTSGEEEPLSLDELQDASEFGIVDFDGKQTVDFPQDERLVGLVALVIARKAKTASDAEATDRTGNVAIAAGEILSLVADRGRAISAGREALRTCLNKDGRETPRVLGILAALLAQHGSLEFGITRLGRELLEALVKTAISPPTGRVLRMSSASASSRGSQFVDLKRAAAPAALLVGELAETGDLPDLPERVRSESRGWTDICVAVARVKNRPDLLEPLLDAGIAADACDVPSQEIWKVLADAYGASVCAALDSRLKSTPVNNLTALRSLLNLAKKLNVADRAIVTIFSRMCSALTLKLRTTGRMDSIQELLADLLGDARARDVVLSPTAVRALMTTAFVTVPAVINPLLLLVVRDNPDLVAAVADRLCDHDPDRRINVAPQINFDALCAPALTLASSGIRPHIIAMCCEGWAAVVTEPDWSEDRPEAIIEAVVANPPSPGELEQAEQIIRRSALLSRCDAALLHLRLLATASTPDGRQTPAASIHPPTAHVADVQPTNEIRAQKSTPARPPAKALVINEAGDNALLIGRPLPLSSQKMRLLVVLAKRATQTVTTEELLNTMSTGERDTGEGNLATVLGELRAELVRALEHATPDQRAAIERGLPLPSPKKNVGKLGTRLLKSKSGIGYVLNLSPELIEFSE